MLLLVFPWLGWPLTLLGLVGMGKGSLNLFHAFWDGLGQGQHAELLAAAYDAGVSLRRVLNGEQGASARGVA